MAELKKKITLKSKGEEAYISVKQLMITLKWTADVDLDLMAFYLTQRETTGGVFTDQIPGGSLGSLNDFPYIQHSGDEGVGAVGGDNQEQIRITKLDDILEIYICALNYTDASQNKDVSFSAYDGCVIVTDDKGETITVPLNATEKGHIAVIAKIDNTSPMGPKLVNENRIMDLATFAAKIPGANLLVNV